LHQALDHLFPGDDADEFALGIDHGDEPEEYDPVAKRQLGNFPQAFTHVALINTANPLSGQSRLRRAGKR